MCVMMIVWLSKQNCFWFVKIPFIQRVLEPLHLSDWESWGSDGREPKKRFRLQEENDGFQEEMVEMVDVGEERESPARLRCWGWKGWIVCGWLFQRCLWIKFKILTWRWCRGKLQEPSLSLLSPAPSTSGSQLCGWVQPGWRGSVRSWCLDEEEAWKRFRIGWGRCRWCLEEAAKPIVQLPSWVLQVHGLCSSCICKSYAQSINAI